MSRRPFETFTTAVGDSGRGSGSHLGSACARARVHVRVCARACKIPSPLLADEQRPKAGGAVGGDSARGTAGAGERSWGGDMYMHASMHMC
eukprot:351026-Chlamydomonas_euryale.AAC.2